MLEKMATTDDDELALAESCKELQSAMAIESDLELAFRLQMEETIAASLPSRPSSSSSSSSSPLFLPTVDLTYAKDDENSCFLDLADIQYKELLRFNQELRDREYVESMMRSTTNDLKLRLHDKKFASQILHFPEKQWRETGDWLQRPFGEGTSEIMNDERFNLYFKGLVSEESEAVVAGIGIAVCDASDALIFKLAKKYIIGDVSIEIVELEALVECLNSAIVLGISVVTFFVDDYLTFLYVSGGLQARESKVDELIKQVVSLRKKFTSCEPSLVLRNQVKFAYEFAREAISSERKTRPGSSNGKAVTANCAICLEDITVDQMFSVEGCLHWFCIFCLRQHMIVKLHQGVMPVCPQVGCKSQLSIDKCRSFLSTEMVELMNLRIKESSMQNNEKLYCPYPRCSALLSIHEVWEHTLKFGSGNYGGSGTWCMPSASAEKSGNRGVSGMRRCTKCNGLFCIYCKVQWHENMTCNFYRMSNPCSLAEDAILKSLARRKLWRQCAKCNHMIELATGCNHISCRCGYEFCYVCGAEWKDKKPTCSCRLWVDTNIMY